jgi:lantibiotic modifying enzyme
LSSRENQHAFLQAAAEIAREVRGQASYARDGGIYWTQPSPRDRRDEKSERIRPLDANLYPGTMGIALFFALAAKVLGDPEQGSLALHIVAPLRREIREIVPDPERSRQVRRPVGGLVGLGSLVYGLVRLGDLLGQPVLWDEALELSALITPERIAEDQELEVMRGSAGALLALLALESRRPGPNPAGHTALDLALRAGEHLLDRRDSWTGSPETVPLGFCHGAAGVVCALANLARRTARADLREAAGEGWTYIGNTFDPQLGNWRLPNRGGLPTNSWCNGATGILLCALAPISSPADPVDSSLAAALKTLQTSPIESTDHLCCGNMGRIDALIHASGKLSDPEILRSAEALAASVMERARREGRYRLMFHPADLIDTRLFPGSTGVGYAFLRLAAPGSIPSLLAMA